MDRAGRIGTFLREHRKATAVAGLTACLGIASAAVGAGAVNAEEAGSPPAAVGPGQTFTIGTASPNSKAVACVQEAYRVLAGRDVADADGIGTYGDATATATHDFQEMFGLTLDADKVVGPETSQTLIWFMLKTREKYQTPEASGSASVSGGAEVSGDASVSGGASASGGATATGDASVSGGASASGGGSVSGEATASGGASASGEVNIPGVGSVSGSGSVSGEASASGGGSVSGEASASGGVSGEATASGGVAPIDTATNPADAAIKEFEAKVGVKLGADVDLETVRALVLFVLLNQNADPGTTPTETGDDPTTPFFTGKLGSFPEETGGCWDLMPDYTHEVATAGK